MFNAAAAFVRPPSASITWLTAAIFMTPIITWREDFATPYALILFTP
jgi:hypothetical protein